MSRSAIFTALALILLPPAPPLFAEPIQLGGDIIVPLENRPELGLFVLGFVDGHGPYRFKVISPTEPA
jgi:hypothetical protein